MNRATFDAALHVFFDFETTGFFAAGDAILQVCAVVHHRGKLVAKYSAFNNPGKRLYWKLRSNPRKPTAFDVHGIGVDKVVDCPGWDIVGRRFRATILDARERCGAETVVLVAYNGGFDVRFLTHHNGAFGVGGLGPSVFLCDPLVAAIRVFPPVGGRAQKGEHKQSAVYRRLFGEELRNAHDAEADVAALVRICETSAFAALLPDACKRVDQLCDVASLETTGRCAKCNKTFSIWFPGRWSHWCEPSAPAKEGAGAKAPPEASAKALPAKEEASAKAPPAKPDQGTTGSARKQEVIDERAREKSASDSLKQRVASKARGTATADHPDRVPETASLSKRQGSRARCARCKIVFSTYFAHSCKSPA